MRRIGRLRKRWHEFPNSAFGLFPRRILLVILKFCVMLQLSCGCELGSFCRWCCAHPSVFVQVPWRIRCRVGSEHGDGRLTPHSPSINKHHGVVAMCRQSLAVHLALKMAIVLMHADLEPVAVMSIRS
jgi:hypothetical protein